MLKEIPTLECEMTHAKAINYFVLHLTAYKATAEAIYDRFINVHIVNHIIKPLMKENDKWMHTASLTLLRSAANI